MRSFSPIVRGTPDLALAATLLVSALGPQLTPCGQTAYSRPAGLRST
jgi:hypothetical protein